MLRYRLAIAVVALVGILALSSCAPATTTYSSSQRDSGSDRDDDSDHDDADETPEPTEEPAAPAAVGPAMPASTPVDPALFAMDGWNGVNFVSPSGNLQCGILWYAKPGVVDSWGCAALEHSWAFPSASPDDFCYDSQVDCGNGIQARDGGAPQPMQRGGVEFGSEMGGARVLAYGESVTFGGITCASTEVGTQCVNEKDGHGFLISKSKNQIW